MEKRYGSLSVLEERSALVMCVCDCGSHCKVFKSRLLSGNKKSCGCKRVAKGRHKLYFVHRDMLSRCNNESNKSYKYYGARGIKVHKDFEDSIEVWAKEVGPKPDGCYSLGRKDNSLGYVYGNMQWETPTQQARNRRKHGASEGVTGVLRQTKKVDGKLYEIFVASWVEVSGKRKTKTFSIKKHGEGEALKLAIAEREAAIQRLNSQGAGYAASHGE